MESKKPGMLRNLRQKMLPHLRREKSSTRKSAIHLNYAEDHRLSSSVPDMRDMRKMYAQSPSSTRLQQYNTSSYSNPTSPYVKPGRGQGEGGSGLRIGPVGVEAGRSEHRLSVPVDSVEWTYSQESLSGLCPEERSPSRSNYKLSRGMEPEELALPEMMTVYSPEHPSGDGSQDSSQVWSPQVQLCIKPNKTVTNRHSQLGTINYLKKFPVCRMLKEACLTTHLVLWNCKGRAIIW